MARRAYVPQLHIGEIELEAAQAHHVRDVLRMMQGQVLELFDDVGTQGMGTIIGCSRQGVRVLVERLEAQPQGGMELTIAAAVPKGARADWMIEKLSELGVARFIPLRTERSVVVPEGKNKMERWSRLASEAARQSGRRGVMRIDSLSDLEAVVKEVDLAIWHLSTRDAAEPLAGRAIPRRLMLLVGPEGGWSEQEIDLFGDLDIPAVSLTSTVLRVETAAIAGAAVVLCVR